MRAPLCCPHIPFLHLIYWWRWFPILTNNSAPERGKNWARASMGTILDERLPPRYVIEIMHGACNCAMLPRFKPLGTFNNGNVLVLRILASVVVMLKCIVCCIRCHQWAIYCVHRLNAFFARFTKMFDFLIAQTYQKIAVVMADTHIFYNSLYFWNQMIALLYC